MQDFYKNLEHLIWKYKSALYLSSVLINSDTLPANAKEEKKISQEGIRED